MKTWKPIIAAAVAGLAVFLALIAISVTGDDRPSAQESREHCLYAAIKAYPARSAAGKAIDTVPECKSLSTSDREKTAKLLIEFFESAFDQALTE